MIYRLIPLALAFTVFGWMLGAALHPGHFIGDTEWKRGTVACSGMGGIVGSSDGKRFTCMRGEAEPDDAPEPKAEGVKPRPDYAADLRVRNMFCYTPDGRGIETCYDDQRVEGLR